MSIVWTKENRKMYHVHVLTKLIATFSDAKHENVLIYSHKINFTTDREQSIQTVATQSL